MKRVIIAVLAASTAAVVTAQAETPEGKPAGFRAEMRALISGDGMKVDDLANLMQTRAEARFKALDADGDGIVSKEDFLAATTERAEDRFARMNPDEDGIVKRERGEGWGRHHGGPRSENRGEGKRMSPEQRAERTAAQFDRLDADKDGMISREEFEAGMEARGERFAERREQRREQRAERRGGPRHGMPEEMREMHGQLRALMREGMNLESFTGLMSEQAEARFDALDADGNGELTAQEFTAKVGERAERVFARMDRNDDGVVTSDDRPRHGGPRHGRDKAPKAE